MKNQRVDKQVVR